jgi:Ni,Fe-hydrogenase III large subunit
MKTLIMECFTHEELTDMYIRSLERYNELIKSLDVIREAVKEQDVLYKLERKKRLEVINGRL